MLRQADCCAGLTALVISPVAAPSWTERRIIGIGVVRHLDGDTLLTGFQVSSTALPSIAGGVEIAVGRHSDRHTRLLLSRVTSGAVPTATVAAGKSVTRQCVC